MLNALAFKLIGGLAAVLLLAALVVDRNRWKGKAAAYNAEAIALWHETRDAADNPKLERKDARRQIKELGESNARLKVAIERQNAEVARLGAETARQKQIAAEALRRATGRAEAAVSAADRLIASSRSEARKSAPCAFSDELLRAWR